MPAVIIQYNNKIKTETKNIKISVIIPVYNEEQAVESVINNLKQHLDKFNAEYEIIAINDGSTDNSRLILEKIPGIKLINHPYNKGYGASLKTGANKAEHGWLLWYDADGQHKPEYIGEFIKHVADYDIIVGARQGYQGPMIRQPGKRLLHLVANYLAERKIPDINCGLRLIKKKVSSSTNIFFQTISQSVRPPLCLFSEKA